MQDKGRISLGSAFRLEAEAAMLFAKRYLTKATGLTARKVVGAHVRVHPLNGTQFLVDVRAVDKKRNKEHVKRIEFYRPIAPGFHVVTSAAELQADTGALRVTMVMPLSGTCTREP